MRLHRLEIHNYKSLRNVAIEPTPLSVFVGPNAAGKTNLSDAIEFIGRVYAWGLEKAVAYKGGYENICYRGAGRRRDSIRFSLLVELPIRTETFFLEHVFDLRPKSSKIQAPFSVTFEEVKIYVGGAVGNPLQEIGRFSREGNFLTGSAYDSSRDSSLVKFEEAMHRMTVSALEQGISAGKFESNLMLPALYLLWRTEFEESLGSLRVFQLNPRSCREAGIPTPTPDLDRSGRNLPVALSHLKQEFPREYALLLETLRRVMPSLEDIETDWTHTRALALFIREKGVRRPWTSEDISDGTIQTIALLVAAFDPRSQLIVIEEPENSVHPWALRNLVEAFRTASLKKQIMLTTHSPILIDQLKPEEIWVVRKPETETKIDPLLSLDPSLKESWGQGKFTLSEYLDSGAVPEAVPAATS